MGESQSSSHHISFQPGLPLSEFLGVSTLMKMEGIATYVSELTISLYFPPPPWLS